MRDIKFTQSEHTEIRQGIRRVAVREGLSEAQAREDFQKEIAHGAASSLNPAAKKKKIRRAMYEKSHPVRAAFEKQFNEKRVWLEKHIPGLLKVETHPDFEENGIEISFRVKNEQELKTFLERLSEHAQIFDELLQMLRCENVRVV